ncbi:MarR family winged helix-turn-helix transcriptional regulator [Chitinimonas koreensis]|uniref:MarR family winged helix-turn-helix transcriptional regulator n=1 Tax=Chitinimonas koreensis TaxID=356302 RepID=UPI00040C2779|nr:MarR family transcriptional regulator [Chitinimonas koreensis]QNM97998.1 MarR family transcriptional regulator [Chitinimonas koreensis]
MADTFPPALDRHLCFALYATSLQMTQRYKPLLDPLNLTYPQYLVLLALWEKDGIGLKDLAAQLQQDPGSVTPLVKRLEAAGYLQRRRDAADERNLVITLTESGRALRQQAGEMHCAIQQHCGLNEAELDRLVDELGLLRRRLAGAPPAG